MKTALKLWYLDDNNDDMITVYKNTTQATLTGTTTETVLFSTLIPANSIPVNAILQLDTMFSKSGTNALYNIFFKANTTAVVAGATQIATNQGASTHLYQRLYRTLAFEGTINSQVAYLASNQQPSDFLVNVNGVSALSIDFSVDQYLMVTCALNSAADTATSHYFSVLRY